MNRYELKYKWMMAQLEPRLFYLPTRLRKSKKSYVRLQLWYYTTETSYSSLTSAMLTDTILAVYDLRGKMIYCSAVNYASSGKGIVNKLTSGFQLKSSSILPQSLMYSNDVPDTIMWLPPGKYTVKILQCGKGIRPLDDKNVHVFEIPPNVTNFQINLRIFEIDRITFQFESTPMVEYYHRKRDVHITSDATYEHATDEKNGYSWDDYLINPDLIDADYVHYPAGFLYKSFDKLVYTRKTRNKKDIIGERPVISGANKYDETHNTDPFTKEHCHYYYNYSDDSKQPVDSGALHEFYDSELVFGVAPYYQALVPRNGKRDINKYDGSHTYVYDQISYRQLSGGAQFVCSTYDNYIWLESDVTWYNHGEGSIEGIINKMMNEYGLKINIDYKSEKYPSQCPEYIELCRDAAKGIPKFLEDLSTEPGIKDERRDYYHKLEKYQSNFSKPYTTYSISCDFAINKINTLSNGRVTWEVDPIEIPDDYGTEWPELSAWNWQNGYLERPTAMPIDLISIPTV